MEITKREILVSIAIICIMLILGLLIQTSIRTAITNQNKEFETALQISDTETFKYGMKTNIGNAFVFGKLIAVDPVTNEEIDGEWMWIEKVKERYTMHTRTVTHTVNGKTVTKVEHYWTWDRVGSESWHSNTISFLGVEFPYGIITNIGYGYIKTDRHGNVRYKWYASRTEHEGTIFTNLGNGTITKAELYEGKNTSETYESIIKNETLIIILFWVLWIALSAGLVTGFYALENKWLE